MKPKKSYLKRRAISLIRQQKDKILNYLSSQLGTKKLVRELVCVARGSYKLISQLSTCCFSVTEPGPSTSTKTKKKDFDISLLIHQLRSAIISPKNHLTAVKLYIAFST